MSRTRPSIIVTGTPGVGKTLHCERIAQESGLEYISINKFAKQHDCHDGYDEELQTWVVDDDKLLDALEPLLAKTPSADPSSKPNRGGYLLDWHAVSLFPESWIDLVVVLRASSEILYDRLTSRNYGEKKLQENMDAEIMEVLLDEARESFAPELVIELKSDSREDLTENVGRIAEWIGNWEKARRRDAEIGGESVRGRSTGEDTAGENGNKNAEAITATTGKSKPKRKREGAGDTDEEEEEDD
ncbi:factor activating pos9 [Agyrium rufum]|nr:factor activating pos9 [Agyrium rufum]